VNELDGRQHRWFFPHEEGFHSAVGQISHEARKAERIGAAAGRLAKENPLNPPADEYVRSK
jgi:hypothetical protein